MKRLIILFLWLSLLTGTSLVILSKHWFPIWLGLELRTLSILPLLKTKYLSRRREATLKYFLIQAFRAALLLKGATLNLWIKGNWRLERITKTPICYYIITIAIIIKLGLAPCHFWFPDVLRGLPFLQGIIIACWQKIAPMFILLSITSYISRELLIICSTLSVLIGGWGGLNQIKTRKILAYSSISHLGWVTCTSFFLPKASLLIFIFYILNTRLIFFICHKRKLFSISSLKKTNILPITTILFSISLLSLGGLPPLGGFIKKLVPLTIFVFKKNLLIIPFFLGGRLLSLYFYLRIVFKTSLTLFPQKRLNIIKRRQNPTTKISIIIRGLTALPILGLLLIPLFFLFI